MAEKLVQDPFIKNQNWTYLRTSSLKCYTFWLQILSAQANTFLENNEMKNIILNYIFRLTFQSPFSWSILHVQVEVNQNVLKLRCWPHAFTFTKFFWKTKKRSGTSLPATFSTLFLMEIYFSRYILLLTGQISLPDHLYFLINSVICVL